MKKVLICLFFLQALLWGIVSAQSGYTLLFEREEECMAYCVAATENNEAITALNVSPSGAYPFSQLIRIDEEGTIVRSREFSSPDTAYTIGYIGKALQSGSYLGAGWKWKDDGERYIWLFEFDEALEVRWERFIDTLTAAPNLIHFRSWDDTYFLSASLLTKNISTTETILYKLDGRGVVLKKELLQEAMPVYYLRNIPGTSNFLRSFHGYDNYTYVMNAELEHIATIHPTIYPNNNPTIGFPFDLEFFNNREFIRSGKMERKAFSVRDILVVKKMDTASRNEAVVRKFGYEGSDSERGCHPGALKALAMHPDYFFSGGFGDRLYAPTPYAEYDNFMMVYAFNYDLDSLWSVRLGYDAYYILYYIEPTPDGGCLLVASRYDWRSGEQKRAAYIVKIPKPDFAGIPENTESGKAFVYPNPGADRLYIQAESADFVFQLYNMQGQLLLTSRNGKELVTEDLPPGLYIYRLTDSRRKSVSGKWIKAAGL